MTRNERGKHEKGLYVSVRGFFLTGLFVLICGFPCRSQQIPATGTTNTVFPDPRNTGAFPVASLTEQQQAGTITGTVVDQTGARITGASLKLVREGETSGIEVLSDENGQFFFPNIAPGPFRLSIGSEGLAVQEFSGNIHPGEAYVAPLMRLIIATQVTEVRVALSTEQIADAQVKDQEKQRVFGFIPNFYVSYVPDAAGLAAASI
jgi:Carboxypeptidase regulatory-like domain